MAEHVQVLTTVEEPEILAIPLLAGSQGYLNWVSASTSTPNARLADTD